MSQHQRRPREEGSHDAGLRGQRLETLFLEELQSVLDCEVSDPRLEDVRVTRVELSRDGSRVRVWFAIPAGQPLHGAHAQQTLAAFMRAAGFLRSRLCDALPLKRMPQLRFHPEPCVDLVEEDERLLSRSGEDHDFHHHQG